MKTDNMIFNCMINQKQFIKFCRKSRYEKTNDGFYMMLSVDNKVDIFVGKLMISHNFIFLSQIGYNTFFNFGNALFSYKVQKQMSEMKKTGIELQASILGSKKEAEDTVDNLCLYLESIGCFMGGGIREEFPGCDGQYLLDCFIQIDSNFEENKHNVISYLQSQDISISLIQDEEE